jgi:hemoglobin-like flavoprotein
LPRCPGIPILIAPIRHRIDPEQFQAVAVGVNLNPEHGGRVIDAIFNHSRHRCEKNENFMTRFYENFLASSPRVAEKFAGTDFERQKEALGLSLRMVAMASVGGDAADLYLEYIARRHDRHHLDIEPDLYDLWLESLIDTVRECDPDFDAKVEQAWRSVLRYGIDYMSSRY